MEYEDYPDDWEQEIYETWCDPAEYLPAMADDWDEENLDSRG
jgi:hypothetical protein